MNRVQHLILVASASFALSGVAQAQGNWQWSDHFGGPGHDWGYLGAVDSAGNAYCFGRYALPGATPFYNLYIGGDTLFGTADGFVSKHDALGNVEWALSFSSIYGDAGVQALALDTANNQLIAGGFHTATMTIGSVTLQDSGAFIARIDLDGVCLQAENIGTPSTGCWGVALDDQGNIYASGFITELIIGIQTIGNDTVAAGAFIAKFENDLTPIWAKELITEVQGPFHEPRIYPFTLRYYNEQLFVHGIAGQEASSGPFAADTVEADVPVGGGYALICLDPSTGVAKWMRTMGWPGSGFSIPHQRMDMNSNGDIVCVATVYAGDSTYFGSDTAVAMPSSSYMAYVVRYNQYGELQSLRTYDGDLLFSAVTMADDGTVLMLGSYFNPGTVGGCSGTDGVFMVQLDGAGDCLDAVQVIDNDGIGLGIAETADGIYVCCASPGAPQYGSCVFADSTITRYGFEDVLLAKHDLSLSVGSLQMASNEDLIIYANPNEGSFRLIIPSEFANERLLQLSVYDASGRLVTEGPLDMGEEHPRTDLYNIAPGNYEVTLTNGERSYHGSMVVQ